MASSVRRGLVLSAVAAALAATPARAVLPSGNVIRNGDAETGPAATDSSTILAPPGWTTTGELTQVAYGTSGFPDLATAGSFGGGRQFFAGGNAPVSTATQMIDLSAAAPEIDRGGVRSRITGRTGGFDGQADRAEVRATYRSATGAALGTFGLGQATPLARNGQTTLLARQAFLTVPRGTRSVEVTITATRSEGSYNDGYADNLNLEVGFGAATTATPRAGSTGVASTVRGTVLVRKPGTTQFVALGPSDAIPVGTLVDTTKGTVRLKVAVERGGTRSGVFNGGLFKFTQPRERVRRKRRLTARLALRGGNFAACRLRADADAARRRTVRYLKAKASGRFSVIGKYSKGIERGTTWTTTDRCDGTLTRVAKGTVVVTDFARHRNVIVRAGRSYLARARR